MQVEVMKLLFFLVPVVVSGFWAWLKRPEPPACYQAEAPRCPGGEASYALNVNLYVKEERRSEFIEVIRAAPASVRPLCALSGALNQKHRQ